MLLLNHHLVNVSLLSLFSHAHSEFIHETANSERFILIIFIPLQEGNEESKKRKVDEDEKINEVEVKGSDIIMIKK